MHVGKAECQFAPGSGEPGGYHAQTLVGSTRSRGRSGRYAMRAVVLQEYGGPEKLKFEDNVPEPQISGGTVLIAAAAASVNPIDWKMRSGRRQKDFLCRFLQFWAAT